MLEVVEMQPLHVIKNDFLSVGRAGRDDQGICRCVGGFAVSVELSHHFHDLSIWREREGLLDAWKSS